MPKLIVLLSIFISISAFADSMQSIVSYLASDSLEGRKPGKDGNILATNYLVTQFQKIGLEPLAKSYTQDFTIFTEMIKSGDNLFSTNSAVETNFQPISYSLSGDLKETPIAFAGFGISIPANDTKLKYDDYAGIDVKDKIVVVFSGDPGIGNQASVFRDPDYVNYRSLFYKLKNAIAHGAKGILLVSDPMSLDSYPSEQAPVFLSSEGGGNRFSIISGRITNEYLNSILKSKKISSLSIQKQIAKTQKPKSFLLNQTGSISVHLKKKTGRVSNIVGVVKGTDPLLSKEVIVIGGHMDHLGWGGDSSMDSSHDAKIHNGADDNASGTALVIDLATKIKKLGTKRTYVFVLFNAEEMGLLGSSHFVDMWARHETDYGKMVGMLNYDMVGRYSTELSVMGTDSSLEINNELKKMTSTLSLSLKSASMGSSDHASFLNKKIPSLFFTTGAHEDYHTSSDTTEKINFSAMNELSKNSISLVKNLDKAATISFNPNYSSGDAPGRSRGYGAHLGCVPEFGQSDDIIGVQCVRASDGSPAKAAGVIAGDVVVQIGDVEIKSIYDLAFALKYYRAGDEIELAWKRGDTLMKQTITLAKSRRH
jgi:hypothetical protein